MFGTHQHFGGKKVDRNARKCLPKNPDRRDGRRAAATSSRLGMDASHGAAPRAVSSSHPTEPRLLPPTGRGANTRLAPVLGGLV